LAGDKRRGVVSSDLLAAAAGHSVFWWRWWRNPWKHGENRKKWWPLWELFGVVAGDLRRGAGGLILTKVLIQVAQVAQVAFAGKMAKGSGTALDGQWRT